VSDKTAVDLSVVVPALNEADSLPELVERIAAGAKVAGVTHEVWIIDDGSTDDTSEVIDRLRQDHPELHAIEFTRNYGKAAALSAGFEAADGRFVITMDADLQDDPAEIPELLAKLNAGWDLVSGWKQSRRDSFIKNNTSKIFNGVTSKAVGLKLHDYNCGLKAYRREVCEAVRLYGEMHRYIPAQAHLQGFRVTEIPVQHHRRKHGVTKYGSNRFLNGFLDLLTLMFLSRRATSPLHLFGRMGLMFTAVGGGILLWFLGQWIMGEGLRIRPLMLLGVTFIILAVQFVSLGLVAELVVAGHRPESEYRVRRRV
jgi:glycosyltransferase involved in cell wall biosynthesis